MTDTPPDIPLKPARESLWDRASIVWVIPLAALAIALGVAWQSYADRGPLIEIVFDAAPGVTANETELRYRDVTVGLVEEVTFTEGLNKVLVSVRVDKDVAPYVDDGAVFWIVSPEVTTRGVSGLDTVLSGVFIEGLWDGTAGGLQSRFDGRADAPLFGVGETGLRFELRSTRDSGLTDQTPILYKGIEVGRIGTARISRDGRAVFAEAVIYAPHDRLVTTATRFWDTSGFTFSIGANGAALDFSSLASLVSGGVTFETFTSGGMPAQAETVFELFPDEGSARNSVFDEGQGEAVDLSVIFEENVSGLSVDAPVELGGVRVGRVTGLSGVVDAERFGDSRVRLLASLAIRPSRLGLAGDGGEEEVLAFLDSQVAAGLRARLATASLLTGGLRVELVQVEEAEPAALDRDAEPFPILPSTGSDIADVSASAEGVFQRINALPIEDLLASAIGFLDKATVLIASEDLQQTPAEMRGLLADLRGVTQSEVVQDLPDQAATLIADLQATVADLRSIIATVEAAETVDRLLAAVDAAGVAASDVSGALEGLPALIERIEAVAAKAEALPLESLVAEATALVDTTDALLAGDGAQALPATLEATLAELERVLAGLNEQDGTARLLAAIDATSVAAGDVSSAVEGVPDLIARIDAVAAKAETVPLDELSAELTALLDSAEAVIGTEAARQLPGALGDALDELGEMLAELRAGGTVENTNATLGAARDAAEAIARSTEDLPAVIARVDRVLAQAAQTLSDLDGQSALGREARAALRDIQQAADAVGSLARTLERRPNSILLGR